MRIRSAPLAALAILLAASRAGADDSNYRPYILGGRAGGMGGAFTALADDASGPYYNPGGVAFVEKSQISLTASVYGLVSGTEEAALGAGHDFTFADLDIFPVSTASVFRFGDGNAIAVSVFVPDAFHADDKTSLTAGNNQNAVFVAQDEQTIWVGATYARRLGRVGLGISAFGLLGTSTTHLDLTAVASTSNFATLSGRSDLTVIGVVGAAGLRWDVTDALRLGLSFYSPELGLHGSRSQFVRAVAPVDQGPPVPPASIVVVNQDGLQASPTLPFRAQAGIAYAANGLTLAADVIVLGALDVIDDPHAPGSTGPDFERHVVRNLVVNGSAGLEWFASEAVPLRLGVFTDFAASPEPVAKPPGQADTNASNTSHINRYGGTLSAGYHTDHTATDLGVIFSYGSGTDLQARDFNLDDLVPTRSSQTLLYVFLSSAYRF